MKKLCLFLLAFSFLFMFAGCGEIPQNYEISVSVNGANFGTVTDVSGEYVEGTEVTLTASPYSAEENPFFCWLLNNKVVSNESSYTFEISKETAGDYVALFNCIDLEFIYLESLSFTNAVPASSGDTIYQLKELSLYFGNAEDELINVYSLTDEEVLESDVINVLSDVMYAENEFPFAFNKTKDMYIKVVAKYSSTLDETELEYISETNFVYPKSTEISADSVIENIENKTLELTKNTANENLPSLETVVEDVQQQSTISLNFKKLAEFTFPADETEEDAE